MYICVYIYIYIYIYIISLVCYVILYHTHRDVVCEDVGSNVIAY